MLRMEPLRLCCCCNPCVFTRNELADRCKELADRAGDCFIKMEFDRFGLWLLLLLALFETCSVDRAFMMRCDWRECCVVALMMCGVQGHVVQGKAKHTAAANLAIHTMRPFTISN